jgi:ABC-type multidrug transport system fused ATPase/permease subunit
MTGVASLMALLAPWPLAILIDTVLGNEPLPSLLGAVGEIDRGTLLILAVVSGVLVTGIEHGLAVVDDYVNTKLDQGMVLDLRSQMMRHAQRLSLAYHDTKKTGQLMYQINNQASSLGEVTVAIPPLLKSALTLVGMFLIVHRIEPTLALISLTVVPLIYGSAGYYAKRIEPTVYHVRKLEGQSLSIVHETMAMLRVIVAFGREKHEYRRFRVQAEEAVDARVKLTVRQTVFSLVVTMITALGTAGVLGFGAYHVLRNDLTAGELLVVMGYIASMYKPLEQISNTVSSLQQQFISLKSAFDLLDTVPEIKERPGSLVLGRAEGRVAFEGVSFNYNGRRGTLRDVSFVVEPGRARGRRRPYGRGQEHAPEPAAALLRPAVRAADARRPRSARPHGRVPARAVQRRAPGAAAVFREHRREHPLRPSGGDRCGGPRGGRGGQLPRLRLRAPQGLRDRARRARRAALRRRAPAHLRGPCLPA